MTQQLLGQVIVCIPKTIALFNNQSDVTIDPVKNTYIVKTRPRNHGNRFVSQS